MADVAVAQAVGIRGLFVDPDRKRLQSAVQQILDGASLWGVRPTSVSSAQLWQPLG
ncbi:hypothetical protein [Streptomyces sp. NPDC051554]|uniref:hypothetical protein n=1 Tax=Streptomyces sp. NPDC051554 TaxID=3365656 RepID=UPI0037AB8EC3